jgi:hypothetical protein
MSLYICRTCVLSRARPLLSTVNPPVPGRGLTSTCPAGVHAHHQLPCAPYHVQFTEVSPHYCCCEQTFAPSEVGHFYFTLPFCSHRGPALKTLLANCLFQTDSPHLPFSGVSQCRQHSCTPEGECHMAQIGSAEAQALRSQALQPQTLRQPRTGSIRSQCE